MSEPEIAAPAPVTLDLPPGTYYWCACGRSKNQPHCDGSHAGTGIEPREFVVEKQKKAAYCQCKHTEKAPFCDGAHRLLP